MSTLEILTAARELISDRKKWTKGETARDSRSRTVSPRDERAVRWCSFGAVVKVTGPDYSAAWCAKRTMDRHIPEIGLYHFNDTHTHAEVLAAFDKAIEAERRAKS